MYMEVFCVRESESALCDQFIYSFIAKERDTNQRPFPVLETFMENGVGVAVRCGNYSDAVKLLDQVLQQARRDDSARVTQLLCNRAYCYHQLGLLRKAVKACRPYLAHGCTALALNALLFLRVVTVEWHGPTCKHCGSLCQNK